MKQKQTLPVLPGILFAILIVLGILNLITTLGSGFFPSLGWILRIGGYAVISYSILTSRRDIVLVVGFAVTTLASLLGNSGIFTILAWLSALFVCIVYLTDYLPQLTKTASTMRPIPAAFICVGWVVHAIQAIIFSAGWFNVIFSLITNLILTAALLYSMDYIMDPLNKQQIKTAEAPVQETAEEPADEQTNYFDNYTPVNSGLDAIEEMKKYKDLLDCGAISQEEFDAKKKQLLNL